MPETRDKTGTPMCREWRFTGLVQGVGFRPAVYRAAAELGLTGWVRNDPTGVTVRACADPETLDRFEPTLRAHLPPLAHIESARAHDLADHPPEKHFRIIESDYSGQAAPRVAADTATCPSCLAELLDPADRRHRHPLINCTDCGPRYTIVRDTPYDRPATTMAPFAMCPACAREYENPADRRFHAQPNCCPDCGPRLTLTGAGGGPIPGDPIALAADLLRAGAILAIKGLGGYHLACDATNAQAVATLRERKSRDHKPFAIMVADLPAARRLTKLSPAAEAALTSPAAPIVLAPARANTGLAPPIAQTVAPGVHRLGVMLPNTPVHHLLFAEGLGPLVMTSANRAHEPLVSEDHDARLTGVYDAVLAHDRAIERAVDDSVLLDTRRGPLMLRRARGYVPDPLPLPVPAPAPGLCAGAELKNTVALVTTDAAILAQHVGDLSHTLACERFARTIDDLLRLYEVEPEWIACDPHPGYVSRNRAHKIARDRNIPLVEVQHHHAHLASVLAENGRTEPTIGLICDGVGYGDDGSAWGGEVLAGDLVSCARLGCLRPLRLPGGDAAAVRTGRCAAAWLHDRYGDDHPAHERVLPDPAERAAVLRMLRLGRNAPHSSGAGRLFDAAAALLGICDHNHYEAMSGQTLESAAFCAQERPSGAELMPIAHENDLIEIDHRPLLDRLLAGLARNEPIDSLAWLFHDALAGGLVRAAAAACERTGLRTVALSGGVFCNELLTDLVADGLVRTGLEPLVHNATPPNDGGLSYGQAAVAAARLRVGFQGGA